MVVAAPRGDTVRVRACIWPGCPVSTVTPITASRRSRQGFEDLARQLLQLLVRAKSEAVHPKVTTMKILFLVCLSGVVVPAGSVAAQRNSAGTYHVVRQIQLGGEGGWDYVTIDTVG